MRKIEPAFLCLLYKIELYTKPNQNPRAHEARFSRYVIYMKVYISTSMEYFSIRAIVYKIHEEYKDIWCVCSCANVYYSSK